jgi:uroporphyrinogen-III decarboxylase
MVYMPAQWGAGAKLQWYDDYGYENFFIIVAAYPDHAKKLMEMGGATGRIKNRLVAQAVREGLYPHTILLGEDICSQQGPMISPEFLEEFYAPQLKKGLEPLLEVGCKPVWHSDGNIRPLIDMLINCGIQGFQGFQPECGVTLEFILEHRTREGEPLIIFGPLAVTTELPVLSPAEVKERVRRAIRLCEKDARLVLFTSNTINPDIPFENLTAMYEAVLEN